MTSNQVLPLAGSKKTLCTNMLTRHATRAVSLAATSTAPQAEPNWLHRSRCFTELLEARKRHHVRIEKCNVELKRHGALDVMRMNRYISTPSDVARHVSKDAASTAVLARLSSKFASKELRALAPTSIVETSSTDVFWDMHRPLDEPSVSMELLTFNDASLFDVNQAYWRSCAFLLGAVVERSLRSSADVQLHSWPHLDHRKTSSFVYDISLRLEEDNWSPSRSELRLLSYAASKLIRELISSNAHFERLEITLPKAEEMFRYDAHKLHQLDAIAAKQPEANTVPVYRLGEHVDISRGPMISHAGQFGYFAVTNGHTLRALEDGRRLYRLQGVSLPSSQRLNAFAWEILQRDSAKINTIRPIDL